MVDLLTEEVRRHDGLYVHDLNLRFDFVRADRPLVGGVYDFVYPHTLAGTIAFGGDRLGTNSDYMGAWIRETLRRRCSLPDHAIRVVNTGFDTTRYRPGLRSMRERLALAPEAIAVLFPHCPEESKGLHDAIRVIAALRERLSAEMFARVRLLVPVWPDRPGGACPQGRSGRRRRRRGPSGRGYWPARTMGEDLLDQLRGRYPLSTALQETRTRFWDAGAIRARLSRRRVC
ncbi:hypothetical protein [Micromonospora sp. KC213]|uniref:hypothetical protein n=1 Tax=Micromonospora sp. KC213 TaxID=2530378 RepID=UPI001042A248|nr:hypothetical protein [Micromonospora sp. KC213]TDC44252.1 hypothetical protein E1166_00160 [Micromonospora sp. KC213]